MRNLDTLELDILKTILHEGKFMREIINALLQPPRSRQHEIIHVLTLLSSEGLIASYFSNKYQARIYKTTMQGQKRLDEVNR